MNEAIESTGWTEIATPKPAKPINAEGWQEVVTPNNSESFSVSDPQYQVEGAKQTVGFLPKLLPAAGMVAGSMAAAPFTGGMSLIPAAALGIGAAATGAGLGKMAEQKVSGQDINMGEVGESAKSAALWESGFRTLGLAAKPIADYVANSPRILNAIARVTSSLSKQEVSKSTILEGMQRAGIGGKIERIEKTTKDIKYGKPSVRNLAMDEVTVAKKEGAIILENVQTTLRGIRKEVGKEIGAVDDALDNLAAQKGVNYIDLSPVTKSMADDISFIQANPILKDTVSTAKLEKVVQNVSKNPLMTVADAIKTKKVIQKTFEDFSNVGVMKVKDMDILEQSMKETRQTLDGIIKKKAVDLGMKEYAATYEKFGKYADDYDETLLPLFGSKEGGLATTTRFSKLSSEVSRRGNVLDILKNTESILPNSTLTMSAKEGIKNLGDHLVIHALFKEIGSAPSSLTVGLLREWAVHPLIKGAVKMADITTPAVFKTSASKLAPIAKAVSDELPKNEKDK